MKMSFKEAVLKLTLMGSVFGYVISPSYGMDADSEKEGKKSQNHQERKFWIKGNKSQDAVSSFSSLERRIKEKNQQTLSEPALRKTTQSFSLETLNDQDIELWRRAAEQNHFSSLYNVVGRLARLGVRKESFKEFSKDYTQDALLEKSEAFYWWQTAHTSEDAEAWFQLGKLYNHGQGVKQDCREALKWFRKAADKHHPYAPLHIEWLYKWSQDLPQDTEKAIEWCRTAGDCHYYGLKGVTQDYVKALEWYHKAANFGNVTTQYQLGILYEAGAGVQRNPFLYEAGTEVPRNPVEAAKWFSKAITQDVTYGNKIGDLYAYGGIGTRQIQQNYRKAMDWYLESARREDASAQIKIGVLYETGKGVERNPIEAAKWFNRAFAQRYSSAQYISYLYLYGLEGIQENWLQALKWHRVNIKEHAEAQFEMGLLYCKGEEVLQDYTKAWRWFLKAANQNHADAQYNVGVLCHSGQGVEQDYIKAMEWYQKAASNDHPAAQNTIGIFYEWGQGVTRNLEEAEKWYRLASSNGSDSAKENLERLEKQQ